MKKVTLADQLELTKEIVASLTDEQLQEVEGGADRPLISCIGGQGSCATKVATLEETAE